MKEITVRTWEEFEEELKKLNSWKDERRKNPLLLVPDFLFRGQADSKWELKTTLDRYAVSAIKLSKYYEIIFHSKSVIESFTEKTWNVPSQKEHDKWLKEVVGSEFGNHMLDFHASGYMAYLRHSGFPSPLLDWTVSRYISAFFAFNNVNENVEYVSIYVFLKSTGIESVSVGEPMIQILGEYVRTHKRHYLQQSRYTICTEIKDGGLYYVPHTCVTSNGNKEQDYLRKFNIPKGERVKVLEILDKVNINSFSLFASEESLMDTIAKREFLIKKRLGK